MSDCAFCDPDNLDGVIRANRVTYVLTPLNPVTEGHVLVIPFEHVSKPDESPFASASAMAEAAVQARLHRYEDYNIIVNAGTRATQTVPHLHVHLVPRRPGDGLPLPWTGQR